MCAWMQNKVTLKQEADRCRANYTNEQAEEPRNEEWTSMEQVSHCCDGAVSQNMKRDRTTASTKRIDYGEKCTWRIRWLSVERMHSNF